MLKVGLTGGIASGKSTVAAMFVELGARLIDTDVIAREVVAPGGPVLESIEKAFGKEAFDENGDLDRLKLREKIFEDQEARNKLNAIVHPAVAAGVQAQFNEIDQSNPNAVALVDVPLLYETDTEDRYDVVVLVYVPPRLQVQRLMKRDNVSVEAAEQSLKAQMPIEEKRKKAQFVVDNSGSLQETRKQVHAVWQTLYNAAHQSQPESIRPSN
jgi:dephospho-CoA kinase